MAKKLIIFGTGAFAALLRHYFENDGDYVVGAFTVDAEFCTSTEVDGLPLIPFDEIVDRMPPESFDMFVAIGYAQMNALREAKCLAAQKMGYALPSYVSSKANVEAATSIGKNCLIFGGTNVQPFATIEDGAFIWGASYISHHCRIGSYAFLAAQVCLGGMTEIGHHAFLGLNTTVRDNTRVAPRTLCGPSSVILSDTTAEAVHIVGHTPAAKMSLDRYLKMVQF